MSGNEKDFNPGEELVFSRFERMVQKYPQKTAVVFLGEKYSFARLMNLIDRFAAGLSGQGVKQGDRVILYLSNCIQWVVAFFGIQKIGAVVVPVSPIYTSHEVSYMIQDSGAETIICHDTNFGYVKETFGTTELKRAIVTNLVDLLPLPKRTLGFLFDKIPHGVVEKSEKVLLFKELLKSSPTPPSVKIDPWKDLAYILYTGGTTGFPKGVPGNHAGMTSYVNDLMEDVLKGYIQEGGDTYIAINPLFHIMALGFFVAAGLNSGNTTILMPQPQVDAILEAIEKYKVRWMLGVPTLYRMILENDRLEQYRLDTLRYCYCGGDVLPLEVFNRWKEKIGVPIYQVYGSTEVGHISYSRLNREPNPLSIGFPLKSRRVKVVNPETLEPVPFGETGELLITSDFTLKQYLNKPEETARSYVIIDGQTYYRMGDFVSQNEQGELVYVERLADIIKYKGYRVSASEIEAVLQDHPTVIGACVVGIPDPKVGERIKGIVVLKADAKGVGASELIRLCRERLAPYKVPQYIEFRDMLPKSKVGKLLRREIRDEEKRKMEKGKK
ncbi:MAG: AMP-binding protein [Thermodesulfobacteriota bacterium]